MLKERKANSAWRKLRRNKSAMFGLILVVFVTLFSLVGPFIYKVDPAARIFKSKCEAWYTGSSIRG